MGRAVGRVRVWSSAEVWETGVVAPDVARAAPHVREALRAALQQIVGRGPLGSGQSGAGRGRRGPLRRRGEVGELALCELNDGRFRLFGK